MGGMIKAHTIEYVNKFCESIEIECEDSVYIGCMKKMNFKCNKCGYRWQTRFNNIQQGHRCPNFPCNSNGKKSIEHVREFCSDKDFICTDSVYVNNYTKMNLKCNKCGHRWKTMFNSIQQGHRCPNFPCNSMGVKPIEYVREFCSDKDFICTDSVYVNSRTKMNFICNKCGHSWSTTFSSIKNNGSGCPICNSNQWTKEGKCRKAIEELTGQSFMCPSPSWLIYERPMRFDGYNKVLNVAIEYNGEQHYNLVEKFKMTEEILALNQDRDRVKAELCRRHGVYLIVVPYWIKAKEFSSFIKNQLEQRPVSALMAM